MSHGLDLSKAYAESLNHAKRAGMAKAIADMWRVAKVLYLEPAQDLSLAAFEAGIKLMGDDAPVMLVCGPGYEDAVVELLLAGPRGITCIIAPPQVLMDPRAWSLTGSRSMMVSLP